MDAVRYFVSEAAISLWRRRRASLIAVLTIAAAMAIPGAFAVMADNSQRLLARWQESAEMSVFLRDDASREQVGIIEREIDASGLTANRYFVSKSEALQRFRRDFPDLGAAAASLQENPLPASIEARLTPERSSTAALDALAGRLDALPGVADVRLDRSWLSRVTALMQVAQALGSAIAFLLAMAAAFTVANVVRLATIARQQEIEIMQLVGAPALYVRGPFVAEGVLQGGLGSLVAVIILWVGLAAMRMRYGAVLTESLGLAGFTFMTPGLALLLIVGGMAIGCLGGFVAARGVRTN
jgi:cell division transport system permease protein